VSTNYHETIAELEERISYLESELCLALRVDQVSKLVSIGFTPSEAAQMLTLYQTGRTMSDVALFDSIDHKCDGTDHKIVQVYVSRIRKHVGYDAIETVRGMGYRITPLGRRVVEGLLAG